jgi:regulatory protein YycH of two-component signal transduction system YycFG
VHCLNNKTNIILNLAVLLSCVKTYFCWTKTIKINYVRR